jgi:sugar (pentulose or hexulose) kinase
VRAALLGVDVGTESVRALVVDEQGRRLAAAAAPLRTTFPQPGWAEQDPEEVWRALTAAIREATGRVDGSIVACALATTSVTLVTADADGAPTGPAILWMDTRAAPEADEVTATAHPALWYTGGRVSAEWMLPKTLWLARHEPGRYRAAAHVVELHDWLLYRLTGHWTSSLGLAASGWTYVPGLGGWQDDLLDALGLAHARSGRPSAPGAPDARAGVVTDAAAAACGLASGTAVAHGTMDSYAAALACGVLARGRLSFSLGSSSCALAVVDEPRSDPRLLGPVPDAFEPGRYGIQGGQTSAGSVARWFRTTFAPDASFARLDLEAARWPIGAGGVRAIETFQGSRTPFRDHARRGALHGLSLAHDRGAVYRALLEAVAVGARVIVDAMHDTCPPFREIVACGGGSRSALWMQLHADSIGLPIETLDEPSAAALGAAICAAACSGLYPDLGGAAEAMTRRGPGYAPDPVAVGVFDGLRAEYLEVGEALASARAHRASA